MDDILELHHRTIFYSIERGIKEYRKFAQKRLNSVLTDITIDQALVLLYVIKQPQLSQSEIGSLTFKDNASVTRMIELLIKNNYLSRYINQEDRRTYNILPTHKGKVAVKKIMEITELNRKRVLKNITNKELEQTKRLLNKLIVNCNETDHGQHI